MSVTIEDIDVGELQSARDDVMKVADAVGVEWAGPFEEANLELRDAVRAVDEDGTFEDSLTDAIACCETALDHLEDELALVVREHQAGRVKASNEQVEFVVDRIRSAINHIEEWVDEARSILRGLD